MSMKLIVLGLLMEGEKHPYEIQHMMKDREMDRYIKFKKGSLYYAVDQLAKDGLIEVVETIREGNRPDRTIYRITPSGCEEFHNLLLLQFTRSQDYYDPLFAALAFANYGDPEAIAAALLRRINEQEIRLAILEKIYQQHLPLVCRSTLHILNSSREYAQIQLSFLKRLHQDIQAGRMSEIGQPILDEEYTF